VLLLFYSHFVIIIWREITWCSLFLNCIGSSRVLTVPACRWACLAQTGSHWAINEFFLFQSQVTSQCFSSNCSSCSVAIYLNWFTTGICPLLLHWDKNLLQCITWWCIVLLIHVCTCDTFIVCDVWLGVHVNWK